MVGTWEDDAESNAGKGELAGKFSREDWGTLNDCVGAIYATLY